MQLAPSHLYCVAYARISATRPILRWATCFPTLPFCLLLLLPIKIQSTRYIYILRIFTMRRFFFYYFIIIAVDSNETTDKRVHCLCMCVSELIIQWDDRSHKIIEIFMTVHIQLRVKLSVHYSRVHLFIRKCIKTQYINPMSTIYCSIDNFIFDKFHDLGSVKIAINGFEWFMNAWPTAILLTNPSLTGYMYHISFPCHMLLIKSNFFFDLLYKNVCSFDLITHKFFWLY